MKPLLLILFFFLEISYSSGDHYKLEKKYVARSIASRQWRQISGPAVANIEKPDHDTTLVTNLNIPGDYQFEYSVTDNGGLTASDTMTVTVHPAVVLPLQLLNFTAKPEAGDNLLQWQTAQEQNTSRFEIESSANGTDFSRIGKILAAGNSSVTKSYSFKDFGYFFTTYYRLKQIDRDEKFTYSNVIKVVNNHFKEKLVAQSPIQLQMVLIIFSSTQQSAIINLYDVTGRLIMNAGTGCDIGANRRQYDVSKYEPGIYILQVKLKDGVSLQQKMVIMK